MGSGVLHLELVFPVLLAANVLFIAALALPLIRIELEGQHAEASLTTAFESFWRSGMSPLALFALGTVLLAPFVRLVCLSFVTGCLLSGRRLPSLARVYRWAEATRAWCMLDVFIIGALVSMTKLRDLVHVDMAPGLWILMALVWAMALADSLFDGRRLWDLIAPPSDPPADVMPEAILACLHCDELHDARSLVPGSACRRCGSTLYRRKPDSVRITWALALSGAILYVPANIFPVFTVVSFGRDNSSTILGGVRQLANSADWPLAIIIFVASVVVPLIKLLGLAWLLVCVHQPRPKWRRGNTRLHRIIELVGRWSATDVFVAGLLSGLVALDNLATIEPGPGVLAFGAVVFLTIVATKTFDQRLLWDAAERRA